MYYRNAGIAIVVFDITDKGTFDSVNFWVDELQSNAEEHIVIVICGNKIDLEDNRAVPFDVAFTFAQKLGTTYVEASAKAGAGVDLLFHTAVSLYIRSRSKGSLTTSLSSLNPAVEQTETCC
jgi:GTPase SAR1 family protein